MVLEIRTVVILGARCDGRGHGPQGALRLYLDLGADYTGVSTVQTGQNVDIHVCTRVYVQLQKYIYTHGCVKLKNIFQCK